MDVFLFKNVAISLRFYPCLYEDDEYDHENVNI